MACFSAFYFLINCRRRDYNLHLKPEILVDLVEEVLIRDNKIEIAKEMQQNYEKWKFFTKWKKERGQVLKNGKWVKEEQDF